MKNLILFEQFVNEGYDIDLHIATLHYATNKDSFEKLLKELMKKTSWNRSDALYMLDKFRKRIGYDGLKDKYWDSEEDLPYNPRKIQKSDLNLLLKVSPSKAVPNKKWNEGMYKKWIKNMADNGGADNAYDMAQNAKFEPGLLDYVKSMIKKYGGDESPYDRIQWDIETYA